MSNAAANEGQGAVRVGRLVTRTLFVLGGALAGTAAAWLVSDASASADTVVGTSSVTPVTDATVGALGDATSGVSDFSGNVAGGVADATCHQDATTWTAPQSMSEPHPVCAALARGQVGGPAKQVTGARVLEHEVSDRVSDSVSDLTGEAVLAPAQDVLGAFEHIARKPEDTRQVLDQAFTPAPAQDFGRQVWQLLDPAGKGDLVPLPQLPGLAPVEQEPVTGSVGETTETVESATVQLPAAVRAALAMQAAQRAAFDAEHGQGRDGRRDVPSPFTPAQLPVAPSVPSAPGGSTAPGGHLDGLNFGVPFWAAGAVDTAVAAANRAGLRFTPRTPGSQPGVTPD